MNPCPKCVHPDRVRRFWRSVQETDGCWLWTGAVTETGYGHTRLDGETIQAHRLGWIIYHGDIPEGLFVCHNCDVPLCVRPDHLFLGTHQDNMADMVVKGRSAKALGEDAHAAKLTAGEVWEIRQMHVAGGLSQVRLSRMFGVDDSVVCRIVNGKSWRGLARREFAAVARLREEGSK